MIGRRTRGIVWVVCVVLCLAACAGPSRAPGPAGPAFGPHLGRDILEGQAVFAPDPARQQLIDPRPAAHGLSWLGGDAATSVPVAVDRWVWLFGDTLLGTVRDRCPGGMTYCDRDIDGDPSRAMIANSVGVMTRNDDGSFSPLVKFWRLADDGHPAPIFAAADPREFLWPLAAVRVEQHLFVVANRHMRERGLFALGNVFLRVDDPDAPPDTWTFTRHAIPNVLDDTMDPEPLTWSTALAAAGEFLYVFGERGVGIGARTVLCRLALETMAAPGWRPAPEYLLRSASGDGLTWSAEFELARLHELEGLPGTSEATVAYDDRLGWYTFQIPPLTFEVRLYTAPDVIGPWRDHGVVYTIPSPWSTRTPCPRAPECGGGSYIAYAVKAHPELAPSGGQVFSYNVNLAGADRQTVERITERVHGFYVPQIISLVQRPARCPGIVRHSGSGSAVTSGFRREKREPPRRHREWMDRASQPEATCAAVP